MAKSLLAVLRTKRPTATRPDSSGWRDRRAPVRAGQIGPIRREIIFEPLHEQPAPAEPVPAEPRPGTPETEPHEPVPDPS
jgi:hypothetical protein